jgi:hypothetical protein
MTREFINTEFAASSASESVRLVAFETAEIVPGIINDTYFLIVSGTKPYLNMVIELSPLVYIRRPEYWGIEVVGYIPGGIGLPMIAAYTTDALPLNNLLGTKGIEVIGANRSVKIDVPDTELCNERNDVKYRANQIHNEVVLIAEGNHGTPGYDVFFEKSPLRIFPPIFILKHQKPEGNAIQLETPFTTEISFESAEPIEEVTVFDAEGERRIKVDQTPD